MSLSLVRAVSACLALCGLFLVFFEAGASAFGWAVLCVCIGALFAVAAVAVVACALVALVVALVPWAATRAAVVDPARIAGAGIDAVAWLVAAWLDMAGRAFIDTVHFSLTPAVVAGLVLVGLCAAGEVALRWAAHRSRAR